MSVQNTKLEKVMNLSLESFLPTEIKIVGEEGVANINELVLSGAPLRLNEETGIGRKNDTIEVIKLIFEFAAFVKTIYDLYTAYRERMDRKKSTEECHKQLDEGTPVSGIERPEVIHVVIENIEP